MKHWKFGEGKKETETEALRVRLDFRGDASLSGHYTAECGLGSPPYPIHLTKATRCTQAELAAGPTCARPIPKLSTE